MCKWKKDGKMVIFKICLGDEGDRSAHDDTGVPLRLVVDDLCVCRYEEGTEAADPDLPVPNSQGEDLEALLNNLKLTEWSAYSHYRSLVADLNSEPPLATDGSQPKVMETSAGVFPTKK